jgi:hypothetical protein
MVFLTAYNEVKIIEIGETRINKVVAKQYLFGYKDVAASQRATKSIGLYNTIGYCRCACGTMYRIVK